MITFEMSDTQSVAILDNSELCVLNVLESPASSSSGASGAIGTLSFPDPTSPTQRQQSLPFAVSALPLSLRRKLDAAERLTDHDWILITQAVYEKISSTSYYPSKSDYGKMAQDILDRYPHLGGGLSGFDAREEVKTKLVNKFRNKRRHVLDALVVQKKKRNENKHSHEGLPEYLPSDPSVSTLSQKADANQLKRAENPEERRQLLDNTFPARRAFLCESKQPMERFASRYPSLLSYNEIWNEFGRLKGSGESGVQVLETAREKLRAILQKLRKCTAAWDDTDDQLLESLLEEVGCDGALVAGERPYPSFVKDKTVLQVDGVEVPLPDDATMIDKCLTWAAVFPTFNQRYPAGSSARGARQAAILLYRYALGVEGGPKLSQTILMKLKVVLG